MASMRPYSSSKRFLVLFMGLILLASHVQLTKGDNDPLETELSTVAQEVPLPNAIPATAIEERYRLPFLKMRELMNAVYEHKPLASLQYTFESKVYDEPLVAGELKNLSFRHLGPLLHSESTQSSWVAAMFHVPQWPLTPLMLPRMRHVARQFPNVTFLSIDCTDVSSYTLLSWDLSALPSLVLFNSHFNLAQRMGAATSGSLVKFVSRVTEIEPTPVQKDFDFDDVSLRTEDLPRMDSLLVEVLFLIIWGLYSIMRNE